MSHPYGSHSSRGSSSRQGRGGHPNTNMRADGSNEFMSRGRPPGLTGKQIGLYYRDKARQQRRENTVTCLKLDDDLKHRIKAVLKMSCDVNDDDDDNDDNVWFDRSTARSNSNVLEKKYDHIKESHFKKKFIEIITGNIQKKISDAINVNLEMQRNSELDEVLLRKFRERQNYSSYESMAKIRKKLPSYQKKDEILQVINENQVVVISGETGCGKTTQVAQFILDDQLEKGNGSITKIVCTQPRRISAISVANRVAAERAESLGESVGFQIRLEKTLAREHGSIMFCTTGVLLQSMQSNILLRGYSHIILDEIHERSTESDFIITLLKQIIPKRPDLKIILMSATLNSETFSKYYDDCPMLHIPGHTFPVEEFYLEDVLLATRFQFPKDKDPPARYQKHLRKFKDQQHKRNEFEDFIAPYARKLRATKQYPEFVIDQVVNPNSEKVNHDFIEELISYICCTQGPGAILVFLPGMTDINTLNKIMSESGRYPRSSFIVYPLHSLLPTIDQKLIFNEPPPGVRKIILATSIAETSITIEDVVYVVDSGKIKFSKFDVEKNIHTLAPEWVTLANAKQRRGRAGRVKPGVCYHLYSKAREMTLDEYPLPEMLRTRLEEVILRIKILQLGKAKAFLASVMDPPNAKALSLSLDLLKTLNALDNDENLTPLGYHLAKLPLDPRTGKMIIWAALFSCVEPVFTIAASLSFKSAFYCPLGKEEESAQKKRELCMDEYSDHIALAEALRRFEMAYRRGNAGRFCQEYFLSFNTLQLLSDMKRQFGQYLCEMQFLADSDPSDPRANINSKNMELIKAIVCTGSYPNVATVKSASRRGLSCRTPEDGPVSVHPSSVNDKATNLPSPYLIYFMKQRSTAIFLHDTSCVTPPILLFADQNSHIRREKGMCKITLTSTQEFYCDQDTADIIRKLQEELTKLLEYKITHPGTVSWDSREGSVLNAIIELLSQQMR